MEHRNSDRHLQRLAAAGVLLLTSGLLAGCKAQEAATEESAASSVANAPPAVLGNLTAGLDGAAYERILAADGWLPLQDRETCLVQAHTPHGSACRNIPGLQGCSADEGLCRLWFARPDSAQAVELQVTAMGVGSDALSLGALRSATAVPLSGTVPSAPTSCPSGDFRRFLEAFAAHPEARIGLSAPLLHFEQVVEDEESDESRRDVLVQVTRYTAFRFGYRAGSFRLLSGDGQDLGAIEPVIAPQGRDVVDVSLPDDVEGIAYRFRKHGTCWQFVGSPPAA